MTHNKQRESVDAEKDHHVTGKAAILPTWPAFQGEVSCLLEELLPFHTEDLHKRSSTFD